MRSQQKPYYLVSSMTGGKKANSHDLLEIMETSEDKVCDVAVIRNPETESIEIREHKKELLENLQ